MNIRQKKKQFKKRFGFNPPRSISIKTATRIMENKDKFVAAYKRLKEIIADLWECIKTPLIQLVKGLTEVATALISTKEKYSRQRMALAEFQKNALLQQRQQEREVLGIESGINIHNHDRR